MEKEGTTAADFATRHNFRSGANWFFWIAVLSAINSFVVWYFEIKNSLFALGVTQWVDGTAGGFNNVGTGIPLTTQALIIDLLIAAAFAVFGYFARKGSDLAFVIGIFLYVVDALLVLGLKDFFGFGFHLIPLFYIFRGLLASRHLRENATTI